MAAQALARGVLLGAGRASMNLWLRHLTPRIPRFGHLARTAYDEASQALPWPNHRCSRCTWPFWLLPGAALYRTLVARGQHIRGRGKRRDPCID